MVLVIDELLPPTRAISLPSVPAAAPPVTRCQTELAHLVQRLTRLVQEMGDRGLEPEAYAPLAYLRAPFTELSQQAVQLIERLELTAGSAADYLSDLLIAELRATTRGQRLTRMSVPQALRGN